MQPYVTKVLKGNGRLHSSTRDAHVSITYDRLKATQTNLAMPAEAQMIQRKLLDLEETEEPLKKEEKSLRYIS